MQSTKRGAMKACLMTGRRRAARGFTIIELLVAMVVAAILLGLAVPSFREAVLSSRLTGYANDLVASVQIARSEAIKRNAEVTLCASADGATCAEDVGWQVGWIILVPRQEADPDDPNAFITVMDVAKRHERLTRDFVFTEATGLTELAFPPTVAGVTPATFTVCRAEPPGRQERVVRVTSSGSTAVTRTETGDCPAD